MRSILSTLIAAGFLAAATTGAFAQQAPAPSKAAPKAGSNVILMCPQQKGNDKVNVRCKAGEKCCYHPLWDNGSCIPEADSCSGIINPLKPYTK